MDLLNGASGASSMDFVMSGASMDFSDWNSLRSFYGFALLSGACGASMDRSDWLLELL